MRKKMQFPKLGSGKDILIQDCQEILNGHRKAISTLAKQNVPWQKLQSIDNGGIFSKHQATHWSVKKKKNSYQKTFCLYTPPYHRNNLC